MAGKKITQLLSGSLSNLPLSGVTAVVYSGTTFQHNLSHLRQILVDSGSHTFTGSQIINGDLLVDGSVTANQFILSSSITNIDIQNISGSSTFGNDIDDTHQFTGSVLISGSLTVSGDTMNHGRSTQVFNDPGNGNQVDVIRLNPYNDKFGYTITNPTLGWQHYDGTVQGWVQELYTSDYEYGSAVIHESNKHVLHLFPSGSPSTHNKISLSDNGDTTTTIELLSNTILLSGSVSVSGSQHIKDNLVVGLEVHLSESDPESLHVANTGSFNIAHLQGDNNYYSQLNVVNLNSGSLSSTDIVATADNGTEVIHFVDMGINSSTYNGGFVGRENDAYLINVGKDLYVGTVGGSSHPSKLHLFAQNEWENPQITIHTGSQVSFNTGSVTEGYVYEFSGSVKLNNGLTVNGNQIITGSIYMGTGSIILPNGTEISDTGEYGVTSGISLGNNGFNIDFGSNVNDWAIFQEAGLIKMMPSEQFSISIQGNETGWNFNGNGMYFPDDTLQTTAYTGPIETGSFATTGSNTFNGDQTVSGSILLEGERGINIGTGGTYVGMAEGFLYLKDAGGYIQLDAQNPTNYAQIILNADNEDFFYVNHYTTGNNLKFTTSGSLLINEIPYDSHLSTTGSNTFVGNQIVNGFIESQYNGVTQGTLGNGPSGFSLNGEDDKTFGITLSDSVTGPVSWTFLPSGELGVAGNINGAPNLATTGSNTFNGNQIINGTITLDNNSVIKDTANQSISFGVDSAVSGQGTQSTAIGSNAGQTDQGNGATALGALAGNLAQGQSAVSIGALAGSTQQGEWAIAIGAQAGGISQGNYSIALGNLAGGLYQAPNSIVINATGTQLDNTTTSSLKIAPIRNVVGNSGVLQYNTTTKEVSYSDNIVGSFSGSLDYSYLINVPTLVSQSSQISYTGITDVPSDLVSGSSQISNLGFATTGSNTFIGDQNINGILTLNGVSENITVDGGFNGNRTFDFTSGSIFYVTGLTGNGIWNIENVPTSDSKATTFTYIVEQGVTPYSGSGYQINGSNVNILWNNNEIPTGSGGNTDVIGLTAFRVGSSWNVLGSLSTFGS